MVKVAVTGSSGFIGTYLVSRLKGMGINVVELDIAQGIDLTEWHQVEAVESFDVLFHLASRSYVPDSYQYPRDFYYTNINSTVNALELCRVRNAKIIFVSSYVYGIPQYLPVDEKHPLVAFNPYAQTKIIGEQLCQGYSRDFGVSAVVFRPFNVYGRGQKEDFLIPTIIEQAKSGKINLKDPNPKRDMVYVDDVVEAFVKAIDYETGFDIFNIGSGASYSVREIASSVCDLFGGDINVEYEGAKRKTEVPETRADISKAKVLLKWEPQVSINEGLSKIVAAGK